MPVTRSGKNTSCSVPEEEPSGTKATSNPVTTGESSGPTGTTTSSIMDTTISINTHTEGTTVKERQTVRSSSVWSSMSRTERERKQRELELRIKISQEKIALAEAQNEILQLKKMEEEEEAASSAEDEPAGREDDVRKWVKSQEIRMPDGQHLGEERAFIKKQLQEELSSVVQFNKPLNPAVEIKKDIDSKDETKDGGSNDLARAILKAITSAQRPILTPSFMHELPIFDGKCEKWLAFKTVYEDTQALFSGIQNMARLRKALKGTAEEAVKSVLYSECQPEDVMESLRRRFGRPEILVSAELEKLRNLPKATENPQDVCVFASAINNAVAAIRGLKKAHYLNSPEMIKVIIEKLPMLIKYRWFDFAAAHEDPDLALLAIFLNREADRCGPYATQESTGAVKKVANRQATHATAETEEVKRRTCPYCEKNHYIEDCKKFQEASVSERWDIAKKAKLCFKCLRSTHRRESCRKPSCKKCHKGHHQLLHDNTEKGSQKSEDGERKEVANNCHLKDQRRAYLKMVPVEIYGPKGKAQILALLDEGSTVTLLDHEVAEMVGLRGPKEPLSLETVGGRVIKNDNSMRINMKLRGLHASQKRQISGARTIDALRLTPQKIDKARLEECRHLQKIVHKLHYDEKSPKLLIGQDNWELIVTRMTRKGKKGQPAASLTHLGWVLHGTDGEGTVNVNYLTCAHVNTINEEMDNLIKEHFAIESLGVEPRRPSTDTEERAMKLLEKNTRRLENGRFETGLLWKNEEETMPDNFNSALNRLKNIERKLDKDEDLKEEYSMQMENLFSSGYAEEVDHESSSGRKWYLPHFAVTHPTKKKKRLVFDAAARHKGKSLNDALLSGPDLLQSLFGVLLRFRLRPVAVVSDIKEMFLQVKIRNADRDSLRFLWRGEKRTGAPKEYRMTSVIFGAACSPSLAIYVKNLNASESRDQFPEAAEAIERNHYMDDYLHCFETEDEALRVSKEVDMIHKKAGFELRGWASNRERVQMGLSQDEASAEVELGSKEEKTLGLRWFTFRDEIGFRTACLRKAKEVINKNKTPTKRQVTSAVMSTFDPLGLASPVLIQGKKLLQDIWRSGIGWDDEIQCTHETLWANYLRNLHLLEMLRVPRCIHFNNEGDMHIFTDASETAYACAIYWRRRCYENSYEVTLLAGKARVTPLKPVSIPRLELQAALLGTRMAQSISKELGGESIKKTYWTDSTTVLAWIKSDPRTFKTFVAYRLAEIEDTTKPQQWRWVPTKENPADDATREIPMNFDGMHRWFRGPAYLKGNEDGWPKERSTRCEMTGEEKEQQVAATIQVKEYGTPDPSRFSEWNRLRRATARILQFIDICRRKKETVCITKNQDPTWQQSSKKKMTQKLARTATKREEKKFLPLGTAYLEKAEQELLKRSQQESGLKNDGRLKKLDVIEENGVLRLQGRINAALDFNDSFKKPIVLDGKDKIVRLIIAHYHSKFHHGNHATVINEIRQRYWILGLRSAVRMTARQCQWCRVHRGIPIRLPPGDLPRERMAHGEPAFTRTGVDYFGPMMVTVGRRHEKRWGVLFTCLTTRAVHLELAASLSTDSMILALRRMVARRGMPKTIFSDNGTNFVGANKELTEAITEMKSELCSEADKIGLTWKFIAPGAPNMGGAWERLVRSVKVALAVTLKERQPKEEILHTLLLEAEHVVNSRPLTYTVTDHEEEALTPNHFLIGRSCGAPRLGAVTDEDINGRRQWKVAQRLADHFWARWVKEYLPTLTPRRVDEKTKHQDLQCGDTVLIVDSTLPRNCWPRGQIIKTYTGTDGRTRVVDVRTTGGILKRPCSKTVLLVPNDSSSSQSGNHGTKCRDDGEKPDKVEVPDCVTKPRDEFTIQKSPRQGSVLKHKGEDVGDR